MELRKWLLKMRTNIFRITQCISKVQTRTIDCVGGLTTRQPFLGHFLCHLPEKGRREIEEIEEMKERDRGERGKLLVMKVKRKKK